MSAFVQNAFNNQTTAAAISTASPITVTAGNGLIVWIATLNGGTQNLTGNSNSFVRAGSSAVENSVFLSAYFCQNANGGSTTFSTTDTGAFAIYAQEQSGLATSGGSLGFVSNNQSPPGSGANVMTTGATGSLAAPFTFFAFCLDAAGIQSTTPNSGNMLAGTTLSWITRNPSWLTGSSIVDARAEDLDFSSTGAVTATFGTTSGNKQFASIITAGFALPGPLTGPQPAVGSLQLAGTTSSLGTGITPLTAKMRHWEREQARIAQKCREAVRSIFLPPRPYSGLVHC